MTDLPPTPPPYQPPVTPAAQPYPVTPGPPASPPGQGLAIAGLIVGFFAAPVGLILSIIAAVMLSKAGAPKGIAIAGIIVGALFTLMAIVGLIVAVVLFGSIFGNVISTCAELGPGVWEVGGVTYTCD